jgi:hypothetical protein
VAAYAVSARICEVRPNRTSRRPDAARDTTRVIDAGRPPREELAAEYDGHETSGPSWADIVIGWTETTFYLFDPQSWR